MSRLLAGFTALEDVEASFGVARSWTTARTPRIIPTGLEDCQMLRPMSTPAAPACTELYASSSASSSVSSFGPPATTSGTGHPSTTLSKSCSQQHVFTKTASHSAALHDPQQR